MAASAPPRQRMCEGAQSCVRVRVKRGRVQGGVRATTSAYASGRAQARRSNHAWRAFRAVAVAVTVPSAVRAFLVPDALLAQSRLPQTVYSLNVPVPASVSWLAAELAAEWPSARERTRGEHTLVLKRLGTGDRGAYQRLEARAREALRGTPAFEVRVVRVDAFEDAADGASPVVYLAVEAPELERLHQALCDVFEPVEGVEGADYVPHVTVARGGDPTVAERLVGREVEPVEWTVTELVFYDAERGQPVSRVSLPQPP